MIHLQHLRLHQFRCHATWERALNSGVTVFLGSNGKGKTSILESIYLISRLRSFRTVHLNEMMQWNSEAFRVEAQIQFPHRPEVESLAFTWKNSKRLLERNHLPIRDPKEFFGVIPTVLFTPEDQLLVTGGAAVRRHWMDHLLGQQYPHYVDLSQRYHRVLKQRNAWLKEENPKWEIGEVLQQQLEPLAEAITQEREKETQRIIQNLDPMAVKLGFEPGDLKVSYRPRWQGKPDWRSIRERERRLQTTLVGPHRDEWIFEKKEKSVADFGSQGQQRLFSLALRLLEAQHLWQTHGNWPLLLIDDVTHSLDEERRARFHQILPGDAQRLMTLPSARLGDLPPDAEVIPCE